MNAGDRFKALVRPVRQAAPVVRAVEALGARQYRVGRPGGIVDRSIARLLTFNGPDPSDRFRSVEALGELFFELVEATGVERFVEAGAKDAGASVRARTDLGINEVVAYEANPYTHRRFVDTVSAAGVDYRHLALAEEPSEATFLVRLSEEGTPMADGQGSLLVRPDHEPGYERVTVTAVRLDDDLDAGNIVKPTAMWIDVEGATAQVMRGGPGLLAAVEVVIIEVESDRHWDGQEWIDRDVIDFFVGAGLVPVARDRQSRMQYNIVFARTDRPAAAAVLERFRATS